METMRTILVEQNTDPNDDHSQLLSIISDEITKKHLHSLRQSLASKTQDTEPQQSHQGSNPTLLIYFLTSSHEQECSFIPQGKKNL